MRKLYSVPALTAALIAASPGVATGVKDTYDSIFNRKGGIEEVVQAPKNRLEELLGGVAYGQSEVEAKSYNPREEFRKLGWEVYDEIGLKKRFEKTYKSKIMPEELIQHLDGKSPSIKGIFSEAEYLIIKSILDKNLSNDEMNFVAITTDNYLSISISTMNKNIGLNRIYMALKKLNELEASKLRDISHMYR